MDINSTPPCPNTGTIRRNPHRKARATPKNAPQSFNLREIRPFPHDEFLSAQIPENPTLQLPSTSLPHSSNENIKVFLRIRPIVSPKGSGKVGCVADQAPRLRAKSVWPQNPTKKNIAGGTKVSKKKSSGVCILVNDSQSVTLSTPLDLQESKRTKSETYGGFSHVFSYDSSQFAVYERMVKPMVDDFLRGRSGMLAALGPSGSGKTHTVFGSPRDPGMVPLALRHIFKETEPEGKRASRSFYMSIFEIYSERGKAEKLFDLLPDGGELSMQQSTVKGLQEVLISNAEQAESFIAQAVLKRATAMTNTNSQSSRSQCIINIRDIPQKSQGVVNPQSDSAVLTIIDLAGAEREKRTGNQGTRLLESNFINNTLMVFGLCLRSLLEHQKNPKKPLQKHFQNSMLTRYLRDYLEGKKRMSLILTAKSGDEDYLDTSYLLRQASPYMQIKYNEVEPSNMVSKKRHHQASSAMNYAKPSPLLEHSKRMKLVSSEDIVQNDAKSVEEWHTSKEDASTACKLDANSPVSFKSESDSQALSERSHIIMKNFAKVLWNVLKQYNSKLKVAEMEIQSLKESIGYEKKKNLMLETELNESKACCTCCKGGKVKTDTEPQLKLDANESSSVKETNLDLESSSVEASESISAQQNFDLAQMYSQDIICQVKVKDGVVDPDPNKINCDDNKPKSEVRACDSDMVNASEQSGENSSLHNNQIVESFSENEHCTKDVIKSKNDQTNDDYTHHEPDFIVSPPQSRCFIRNDNCSSVELDQPHNWEQEETFYAQASSEPRLDKSDEEPTLGTSYTQLDSEKSDREVWAPSSKPGYHNALEVEAVSKIRSELLDPRDEIRVNSSCKPPKPKRRLVPSSSILLRDLSTLDLVDETEKSKENRSTRKLAADDLKRTSGSISLLRLLKSNLHH